MKGNERWALWVSVASLVVSVATCLLVLLFMVNQGQKVGFLDGRVEERVSLEIALRNEIQIWQAYVVRLQRIMAEAGMKPPAPPVTEHDKEKKGR